MKKFFSLVLLFIFCLSSFSPAVGEEGDDWATLMKNYEKSSDFGKIISNQEFENAIKTREQYSKKADKKKKKKSKDKEPEEPKVIFEIPASPEPLLVLSVDTYYENKVIKQGFYLVNSRKEGEKYFLELRQGNTPAALIEAKRQIIPGKNNLSRKVSIEKIDDKMIKINYTENDFILECVLWIY